MDAFVRASAVLVGMANVFVVSLVGEGELGNALMWNLDPWWPHNALYVLCAIPSGVLVSSVFLAYAGVLLYSSPLTTTEHLLEVSSRLPVTVVAAGVLGAAEGVLLAFPLAAMLGWLGAGD